MRKRIILGVGLPMVGALAFLLGPRVDTRYRPRPISIPADIDGYLARSESRFPDLVPGTEKKVVWARASHAKTPLAIVYLHGFSATRQETAPLCDLVARHLGANLFYTRLTGHGRTGGALAQATVNDWLNDGREAVEVGRRIGDRVVLVGTSTGGTLAVWLALQHLDVPLTCVLISPNFGPKDHRAALLTYPWAARFVPALFGATRQHATHREAERRYWTNAYPTVALIPMMGLVKVVEASDLARMTVPTLVIYSPQDNVVDPRATERAFARIGASRKRCVPVRMDGEGGNHVIAGDIMAPQNTAAVAGTIIRFLAER